MSRVQAGLEQEYFEALKGKILAKLRKGEHLFLNYSGEASQFIRINASRIRQIGTVEDALLELELVLESGGELRKAGHSITLTGLSYEDENRAADALERLRREVPTLPADPYAQLPEKNSQPSSVTRKGELLPIEEAADAILGPAQGTDLAGIYASGTVVRAMANSAGLSHWFATQSSSLDYSLYTASQRALKGTFAGSRWDAAAYEAEIADARQRLMLLEKEPLRIERGAYRTYLGPMAVAEILPMFSWGAVSEASIRQGDSPLRLMRTGEKSFSPRFSLSEDFRGGQVPRFNSEGDLAPELLPVIEKGGFVQALVSARSAKEYGVPSNGAGSDERLRSPVIASGSLETARVLEALGTGLYLSNLHYINWSDLPGGRITGMTRYACFWVENGKIVAPIENLRFDDSLFSLFGDQLIDLTREQTFIPEVMTYFQRHLGGMSVPGMLLGEMKFTL